MYETHVKEKKTICDTLFFIFDPQEIKIIIFIIIIIIIIISSIIIINILTDERSIEKEGT